MKKLEDYPEDYFKQIPKWEHYLIGKSGEIFNTRLKRYKKPGIDNKGYLRVRLINGRDNGATKKIHRLVAAAFLSTYSEDLQVNHKDCNKQNNNVDNLEMVTQSQNTKHAWENKRMVLTQKDSFGRFCKE